MLLLFPLAVSTPQRHTRQSTSQHLLQLQDPCDRRHSDLMARSIVAAIRVFNRLPTSLISKVATVKTIQQKLTHSAREECRAGKPHWQFSFASRTWCIVCILLCYSVSFAGAFFFFFTVSIECFASTMCIYLLFVFPYAFVVRHVFIVSLVVARWFFIGVGHMLNKPTTCSSNEFGQEHRL